MSIVHYGWPVSPYSAKTRAGLKAKGIAFEDRVPSARMLYTRIQRAVGRMIMPTVRLADGTWLQDSSDILDHFEPTGPGLVPADPTLAVASALLELFGDEWLPMAALHYRWNVPENAAFAVEEFARYGFPHFPRIVGRPLIRPMAKRMASYLPALGVTAATIPGVEATTRTTIEALEATLTDRPYLLGGRPCIGDLALYGPLWAHLYRDPGTTGLFDDAPAVVAWMERLTGGARTEGDFEAAVPAALDPVFARIVEDQLAWVRTLVAAIDRYVEDHPDAHRVPRSLGSAPFEIAGCTGERKLATFVQWKAQRARRAWEAADGAADGWMARFGDPATAIPAIAHPFTRVDFRCVLER